MKAIQCIYDQRKLYCAALFNSWAKHYRYFDPNTKGISEYPPDSPLGSSRELTHQVHKSLKYKSGGHIMPGTMSVEPTWFIVMAKLPTGVISHEFDMKDWDLFKVPTMERAMFEIDSTDQDTLASRLAHLVLSEK